MSHSIVSASLVLLASFILSFSVDAEPVDYSIEVVELTPYRSVYEFRLNNFSHKQIERAGKSFDVLEIEGSQNLDENGNPAVPHITKDIMIPNHMVMVDSKILEEESEELTIDLYLPSRGPISRTSDPDKIPYNLSNTYERDEFFPQREVSLRETFKLRNVRGQKIRIYPVQYNPAVKKLKIHRLIRFEIRHAPILEEEISLLDERSNKVDHNFYHLYRQHFFNFDAYESIVRNYSEESGLENMVFDTGKLLIISHPMFTERLKDFIDWKRGKGLWVKLLSLDETGETPEEIKAAIQREYDENQISYVLLVGDAEFLPPHPGRSGNAYRNEADPLYALVDGNDYYPDIFVGRFPVSTDEELWTIIKKTKDYEMNPTIERGWYSRALGISSSEGAWSGLRDDERMDLISEILEPEYPIFHKIYDPTSSGYWGPSIDYDAQIEEMNAVLTEGVGYINYIGHGSQTSWGTTGYSNSDVYSLRNDSKTPFIVSVACVNGNFAKKNGDSFAESWIKAGKPWLKNGAVAIFASSTNQDWVPPTVGQKKIAELLVSRQYQTIGSLFFHGSIAVLEDGSNSAKQTYETWHIFGDPSLQVRTQKPSAIKGRFPMVFEKSQKFFSVDVEEADIVAGINQGDQFLGRAVSQKNGQLTIPIENVLTNKDPVTLVLTGFNKLPRKTEFIVVDR